MRHLDLFSGIGGFAYAVDQVWPGSTHVFCDNNKFCQQVLAKHWPYSRIYGNIKELTWQKQTLKESKNGEAEIKTRSGVIGETTITKTGKDLLLNQEKEQLTDGKRKESLSSNNMAENVLAAESQQRSFLPLTTKTMTETLKEKNLGLPVHTSEQSNKDFQTPINYSVTIATPQKEYTEYAHTNEPVDILTGGFPCQPFSQAGQRRGTNDDRWLWGEMLRIIKETKPRWIIGENVPGIINIQNGMVLEQVCVDLEAEGYEVQPLIIPAVAVNAPHRRDRVWIIANNGCQQRTERNTEKSERTSKNIGGCDWERNWTEVAAEFCVLDDGVPNRVERLKAYGNAIVPQVAIKIMEAIKCIS